MDNFYNFQIILTVLLTKLQKIVIKYFKNLKLINKNVL